MRRNLRCKKIILEATHVSFLDLDISLCQCEYEPRVNDKRGDVSFPIVNFQFLDGDVSLAQWYDVYISQLVYFARTCNNVFDFNARNLTITELLLHRGRHILLKIDSALYNLYESTSTCRDLILVLWQCYQI